MELLGDWKLELIFVDDADTAACTSGRPATYAECNAKSESIPPAYASVTHMTNDARPAGCVFVLSTGAYKYNYGTGDTPSELMARVCTPDNEPAAQIVDGDADTYWSDADASSLLFDFGSPVTIGSYTWTTADMDPSKDPVRWALGGGTSATGEFYPLHVTYSAQSFAVSTARQDDQGDFVVNSCTGCEADLYKAAVGPSFCSECPLNSGTESQTASASIQDCSCKPGYGGEIDAVGDTCGAHCN